MGQEESKERKTITSLFSQNTCDVSHNKLVVILAL